MQKNNRLSFLLGVFVCFTNTLFAQSPQAVAQYQQAQTLFEQKKDTEALELLNKAIGDSPQYEEAILARGRYYAEANQTDRAMQDFSILTRLSPQNINYWLVRGSFLQELGNYDQAENDFLEAFNRDSTKIETINALGGLYFAADLMQDAIKFLDKAILLDNKNYDAHYTRAWVQYELKKIDLALADIKFCEETKKEDANTQRLKALCFLKKKKYDEALQIFNTLLDKKTKLIEEDFLYWGMIYYEKEDYKNALYYLSAPETPTLPDIPYYLGKTYFKLNEVAKANQKLDSTLILLKADNEQGTETELSAPVYYDRAIVRHKAGRIKEAGEDFLQACYLTPEIANQKDYEGNLLPLLGDALNLLKLKKSIVDSTRLKGFQDRAEALILSGDGNRAWAEIQKCETIDSTHARNAWLRAKISIILGKYTEAQQHLDKSERLTKGKSEEEIAYLRAIIYQETGESMKAKEAIGKAIKLNPQAPMYKSLLADIEYSSANTKGAIEAINEAIKAQPQNLGYCMQRAIYLQAVGNYEDAIKDCNKVLEAEPDNAEAYYQRGLAYKATKRYKEALADFQKVEQYDNEDIEIKELIREVTGK